MEIVDIVYICMFLWIRFKIDWIVWKYLRNKFKSEGLKSFKIDWIVWKYDICFAVEADIPEL